jgi:aryl-alcohol dehydrogenase-like predicted oxidoreductase
MLFTPFTAVQNEYSLWSREPEKDILDVCQELGITFVAYSPLGRGFLTGAIQSRADLEKSDWRLTLPRFTEEAIKENLKFVALVEQMARDKKVSKAQIALAWVLPHWRESSDSCHQIIKKCLLEPPNQNLIYQINIK